MKERPILFSAPMVRALLLGTKTQTRRIVKPQPKQTGEWMEWEKSRDISCAWSPALPIGQSMLSLCPYCQPGDRLWVKETWNTSNQWANYKPTDLPEGVPIFFAADYSEAGLEACKPWRPCLFMRRWMSRITLEIVSVRVERLNEISEADAKAEGSQEPSLVPIIGGCLSERDAYAKLWESINGAGSWDANPWVWVLKFKRVEAKPS